MMGNLFYHPMTGDSEGRKIMTRTPFSAAESLIAKALPEATAEERKERIGLHLLYILSFDTDEAIEKTLKSEDIMY